MSHINLYMTQYFSDIFGNYVSNKAKRGVDKAIKLKSGFVSQSMTPFLYLHKRKMQQQEICRVVKKKII